jgi:hypothetical protein
VLCRHENLDRYEYEFLMARSPYERIVGAQKGAGDAFRKVDGDGKYAIPQICVTVFCKCGKGHQLLKL